MEESARCQATDRVGLRFSCACAPRCALAGYGKAACDILTISLRSHSMCVIVFNHNLKHGMYRCA
jgi:hypothetical protein